MSTTSKRSPTEIQIGGVIVAGGQGTRMGGLDKPLLNLQGRPLLEHTVERARPQVMKLALSINRNLHKFTDFSLPLLTDQAGLEPLSEHGPLLGISRAMHHYRDDGQISHLAVFPGDVPIFPTSLITQLAEAMQHDASEVAVSWTGDQIQPLFSLWALHCLQGIDNAIARGIRGPKLVLPEFTSSHVSIHCDEPGAFHNINTPEQLQSLEALLAC